VQRHTNEEGAVAPPYICILWPAEREGPLIRIFVVDDSATARTAIKAALQQRSEWVVVGEAWNGRHALATFLDHKPHLTLMDFIMPEMNGLEAARHLTERHPDVLIETTGKRSKKGRNQRSL
jgi:DNA-binding NarL/FixJ family response regulator